ncbi:receptor-like kinase in in flowers 3 [Actinidia rufa]|uniref:Receptor-like kinase in in flowers 3 n=1 Tax=Actinidia rufa TaxID=165716 RepID=A0A7J0G1K7_9ERIC|nr:receptor-like kinase in in flowers 3 [Actinidia rufa]
MSLLFLSLLLTFSPLAAAANTTADCPLDFAVLRRLVRVSKRPTLDVKSECQYIRQGLRLVQSDHLRTTGRFLPSLASAEACWAAYQTLVNDFVPNFDIRKSCGFNTSWIAEGCMNITTREEFEGNVSKSSLDGVVSACNQSLENSSPCASCTTSLSSLQASYLTGQSVGNVSDCTAYPSIYAAAFANYLGPTDRGTVKCLFSLDFTSSDSNNNQRKIVIYVVVACCGLVLVLGICGFWFLRRKRGKSRRRSEIVRKESSLASGLESISGSTSLIRFTIDEIREATKNFSRDNIIGMGGYGNVYKGVLPDGSEVALKRFKNCSLAGDASFTHEVEVIASVRHVNLVALRGYCTATTPREGHQRIIVCDLMKNGSLHDHVFGLRERKLSWPIRQKIALGTARGLAYLHYGQPSLVTEWAWALVRKGRALDVIEDGMADLGPPEVMEKYVLAAVLCSHPQLYARPTMDQVVKILDMDLPVPSIPDRPIPLIANIDDIEKSVVNSSTGSGNLSSSAGYQAYSFGSDLGSNLKEGESSGGR